MAKHGKRSMAIAICHYGSINSLSDEWLTATLKAALEGEHAGWLPWLKREGHWGTPICYDPPHDDDGPVIEEDVT